MRDFLELVRSLLFIPYRDENGDWAPILGQGWTLNYEMMFYAIFAAALAFRRQIAVPAIGAALVIFTLVGSLLPTGILKYLSSPIVLWFVLGIGLAVLWRWRSFEEPRRLVSSAKFLDPFGDASYSTYLVHGLALTMLLRIPDSRSTIGMVCTGGPHRCNRRWARGSHSGRKTYLTDRD